MVFAQASGELGTAADDLVTRFIKPHSLQKRFLMRRHADIVSCATHTKPWKRYWVELFAGPGRLELPDGEVVDGSALDALDLKYPFDGYFFSDIDSTCVAALDDRTKRADRNVMVRGGDANDPNLHAKIFRFIPRGALVTLYLDPEGLDLDFETIAAFAQRFRSLDLVVNFSPQAIHRVISAGLLGPAKKVLGLLHEDEVKVLSHAGLITEAFYTRLRSLGFTEFDHRTISANGSRQYLMMIASRHPKAIEFFRAAASVEYDGQRTLPGF
jgi:three-Cys-motif partner protein